MKFRQVACLGFLTALLLQFSPARAPAQNISLASPDGNIKFSLQSNGTDPLRFNISFKDHPVVTAATLGITVNGENLAAAATVGNPTTRNFQELHTTPGNHAPRTNPGREIIIPLVSATSNTPWTLEVRSFNAGVGYRYRVPGNATRHINSETSQWILPAGSKIWFQPHNNRGDYEAVFQGGNTLDQLKPAQILAAPATVQLPGNLGYATLTEANLTNYNDMALQYSADNTLSAFFHAAPDGWDADGEILSPWRVTLLSSDLNGLVNADVIQDLCPPPSPELANAQWIQPGRAAWHWMVTGRPQFPAQHQWVDWTRDLGFEYYLIDDGWNRWTGEGGEGREGKDAWACLKDVVDYAKTKNVKIWAWVNCRELLDSAARRPYFEKARAAGVVGLKIDFMDRRPGGGTPLHWIQWYDDTLKEMAEAHLMADFHGAVKPTGRERTWPHELTRESVHGREGGKQPGIHDDTLPFVRYVQGHGDYTPTEFRPDRLKGNSYAKELAGAIIYTSPLLVFSGDPVSYLANDSIDLLKTIPSTWDETIVLPQSEIGRIAAFARRRGSDWFIGVINGAQPRPLKIDLKFLPPGKSFKINQFADSPEKNDAWNHTQATVTAADTLMADLRTDGGFAARLTPSPTQPSGTITP